MKTVHEFLIVSIALALAETGILIASTETEYNPVYGFTDQSCTYNLKFFQSMEAMNAHSRADNGWKHNSYVEFLKSQQCIEVVRAVGTRPKERVKRKKVQIQAVDLAADCHLAQGHPR